MSLSVILAGEGAERGAGAKGGWVYVWDTRDVQITYFTASRVLNTANPYPTVRNWVLLGLPITVGYLEMAKNHFDKVCFGSEILVRSAQHGAI